MSKWINQIFRAAQVSKHGVVRRSKDSVLKYASFKELKRTCIKNGFHLIRNGGQYLIMCNRGNLKILA